jgi:hypothetical protein
MGDIVVEIPISVVLHSSPIFQKGLALGIHTGIERVCWHTVGKGSGNILGYLSIGTP